MEWKCGPRRAGSCLRSPNVEFVRVGPLSVHAIAGESIHERPRSIFALSVTVIPAGLRMFERCLGSACVLVASACASADVEPDQVVGFWGGPHQEVVATPDSMVMNSGCIRVTYPGAITLTASDSFAATGSVTTARYDEQLGQKWKIAGRIAADTFLFRASVFDDGTSTWGSSITGALISGQHATQFPDYCPI